MDGWLGLESWNELPEEPVMAGDSGWPSLLVGWMFVRPALAAAVYIASHASPKPPDFTLIFRCFLSRSNCQNVVGDLEERFALTVQEKGKRAANRWFYREVACSCISLAFAALKRVSGLEKLLRRV